MKKPFNPIPPRFDRLMARKEADQEILAPLAKTQNEWSLLDGDEARQFQLLERMLHDEFDRYARQGPMQNRAKARSHKAAAKGAASPPKAPRKRGSPTRDPFNLLNDIHLCIDVKMTTRFLNDIAVKRNRVRRKSVNFEIQDKYAGTKSASKSTLYRLNKIVEDED